MCSLRRQTRVCCSANGSRRWTASVVMPAARRKAAPSKSLLWPVLAPRALPHASYVLAAGPKLQHRSVTSAWPVGLMDKASASGAGDSRFESWAGQIMVRAGTRQALPPVQPLGPGANCETASGIHASCPSCAPGALPWERGATPETMPSPLGQLSWHSLPSPVVVLAASASMTPAGLEPAIPGSVGRCLIHWATGPCCAR